MRQLQVALWIACCVVAVGCSNKADEQRARQIDACKDAGKQYAVYGYPATADRMRNECYNGRAAPQDMNRPGNRGGYLV